MKPPEINKTSESNRHAARRRLRDGALAAGAALGAIAAVNTIIAWNTPPLGGRLGGGFNRYPARYGDMAYFVTGSGAPLLLLHAPRAGNSSVEWAENYEALARHFTVYALDFLGWGLSDKPRHILRSDDYAEQILHFAQDVIGCDASTPCAVVASGESCGFVLMAARERPELFSRFVLICPTSEEYSLEEKTDARLHPLYQLLTLPIVGEALTNLLTSRARLESEARRELFFDKTQAAGGFITRTHVAAHQPGASQGIAAHLAGVLKTPWREAWSTLSAPALLVWGRNAINNGFETTPEWLALKSDADLEVFSDALRLPHVEHAADFNARILQWLL